MTDADAKEAYDQAKLNLAEAVRLMRENEETILAALAADDPVAIDFCVDAAGSYYGVEEVAYRVE